MTMIKVVTLTGYAVTGLGENESAVRRLTRCAVPSNVNSISVTNMTGYAVLGPEEAPPALTGGVHDVGRRPTAECLDRVRKRAARKDRLFLFG
jgi:hypothetical protein